MILNLIYLILGLAILWGGAELLIRYSSILARSLGVSPVIIGLTVVSIGTSLPEFVVSLIAAIQNTMGISIGNIIGSNIANIGLILGIGGVLSCLKVKKNWVYKEVPFMLFCLKVKKNWVYKEVPFMLFCTLIFVIFARTNFNLGRMEGFILISILILFLAYLSRTSILQMRQYEKNSQKENQINLNRKLLYLFFSILGIILLIVGSKTTVSAGQEIAREIGVSDTVIGLTLIAVGTSLPELATTIVGILKKETDIVVGNVIGSNIFNLLFIGGAVPIIKPIPISNHLFETEIPILVGLSFIIWPFMRIRWNIQRYEGIILLMFYLVFILLTFNSM
jgi:cation:H+ antiporter